MGKRSGRKRPRPKPSRKMETRFDCPVCNHEQVVQCRILSSSATGLARCSTCEAQFRCPATSLDKPVDIYHAWIDAEAGDGRRRGESEAESG